MPAAYCEDQAPTAQRQMRASEKESYGQILKSTAWVGGTSVLNIAIGAVRTKAMALLLGPAGFGLFGLYGSIIEVAQSIAGMGINSSGVRQIAESAGSANPERIARTAAVLRRTSVVLGLLGGILLVALSRQVSILTFGNSQHAVAVSLLSMAVFFRLVSAGQSALIQGMRCISDFAKVGLFGALFGLLLGVPVVYFFREQGVAPSLVAVAGMTVLTSWWYSRKVEVQTRPMTIADVGREASGLLKLGFAFMASSFMMMGTAYLVRITVLHKVSIEATGLYQSAWTLGGLYVAFILQAMGADFYPRLTASAEDHPSCNRLVNEQARVGMLLAGPGGLATLTFAPIVIELFYSAKFAAAVPVLQWVCLGAVLRVIVWPMGYIILAKGRQNLFMITELAWTVVHLSLAWICVSQFGLNGAGIAFFGSYVFHGLLIYSIVRRLTGFRWSRDNGQTGLLLLCLIALVFGANRLLPFAVAACIGTVATLLSGAYSVRVLLSLVSCEFPPAFVRPVRSMLRLFQASARHF
jgi:enterobacterial common antigen flippase